MAIIGFIFCMTFSAWTTYYSARSFYVVHLLTNRGNWFDFVTFLVGVSIGTVSLYFMPFTIAIKLL